MKKIALVVALLGLAGVGHAANPPLPKGPASANSNPVSYQALAFYGATTYRIETSTPTATGVLLGTGPGVLFGAQCTGAGNSDFGQAFDTAQGSGLVLGTQGSALGTGIPAQTSQGASVTQQAFTMWVPAGGSLRFTKGLGFLKSNATAMSCYVYALLDSVTGSGTH